MGMVLQRAGDHPGVPAKAQIGGAPVQHHDEAVAKSDQEIDMREEPKPPRPPARKSEGPGRRAEINHRRVMADGGQFAVILINKGFVGVLAIRCNTLRAPSASQRVTRREPGWGGRQGDN